MTTKLSNPSIDTLVRRVELETLKNQLTNDLFVCDWDGFNQVLLSGLGDVSSLLSLRYSGVFQLSPDGEDTYTPVSIYSSQQGEMPIDFRNMPSQADLPWMAEALRRYQKVLINSVDDLEASAEAERTLLTHCGLQSAAMFALDDHASLVAVFTSDEPRQWPADEIDGLESVATIIRIALDKQRIEIERRLLEEQVQQYQRLEAIGRLTSGIAHDFNNMLVPILGYADSILGSPEPGDWTEEVTEIRKAATSAASLTKQLLTFSKKQIADKRVLDIGAEIQDLRRMIQRMLGENIDLVIEDQAERSSILADQGQMQQVLVNLCVNARDAMPQGGEIRITTANDGDQIIVKVADNGAGMSEELQERIFDPFFSTKGDDGTGLGLSTVKGIVHQHDATLDLDSIEGQGTTFSIRFPLAEGAGARTDSDSVQQSEASVTTIDRTAHYQVLLLEDEPAVTTFVTMALAKLGCEVTTASTCAGALEAYRTCDSFDLIFTDARLPDGSGVDVLETIIADNPEQKALISSGYSDDAAMTAQAEALGVTFLHKPYALDQMLSTVQGILTGKGKVGAVELAA